MKRFFKKFSSLKEFNDSIRKIAEEDFVKLKNSDDSFEAIWNYTISDTGDFKAGGIKEFLMKFEEPENYFGEIVKFASGNLRNLMISTVLTDTFDTLYGFITENAPKIAKQLSIDKEKVVASARKSFWVVIGSKIDNLSPELQDFVIRKISETKKVESF